MRTVRADQVERMMKLKTLWGWLFVREIHTNQFGDKVFACDRSDGNRVLVLPRADEAVQVRDPD